MAIIPTSELRERLIEEVKKNPCLYDFKHKDYKSVAYKMFMWDGIGQILDIESVQAKEMWRALRDGYIRYRRNKAQADSGKKVATYRWSEHMKFLNDTLDAKATSDSPSGTAQQETERPVTPPITIDESPLFKDSPRSSRSASTPPPTIYDCDPLLTPVFESREYKPTQPQSLVLEMKPLETPSASAAKRKRENDETKITDKVDKVLDYLNNKRRKELDAIDFLFSSYAETFRKLSPRKQIELKVGLAKLFAEAELSDHVAEVPIKLEMDY